MELARKILVSMEANTASLCTLGRVGKSLLLPLLFLDIDIGIHFIILLQ